MTSVPPQAERLLSPTVAKAPSTPDRSVSCRSARAVEGVVARPDRRLAPSWWHRSGCRPCPPQPIDEQHLTFGPTEWGLSVAVASIWGSSFLWIAIAIDHVASAGRAAGPLRLRARRVGAVPERSAGGSGASTCRLFAATGLVWMAVPFLLYPIAERDGEHLDHRHDQRRSPRRDHDGDRDVHADSAQPPSHARRHRRCNGHRDDLAGLGRATVRVPTSAASSCSSSPCICYSIAANIARPLQAEYGALPTMLWITLFGALWSLPARHRRRSASSEFTWAAVGALFVLGFVGTGVAFAMYGVLLHRSGPVRGMIGIFFTPIVGLAARGDRPRRRAAADRRASAWSS